MNGPHEIDYRDPIPILRGIIAGVSERWAEQKTVGNPDFKVPLRLLMECADEIARLRDEVELANRRRTAGARQWAKKSKR